MKTRSKPSPKQRALEESGTINTRASDVHDPAFANSDFFDPNDLVQVRYEMLRYVCSEGQSITDTVERFGVTRPTFYRLHADFERAGLMGLLPAKRGPHGPHKITDEVMHFIERARVEDSDLDGPALVERIRRHFGLAVHRRTVERALARSKKNPAELDRRRPRWPPARATLRSPQARCRAAQRRQSRRSRPCAFGAQRHGRMDALRRRAGCTHGLGFARLPDHHVVRRSAFVRWASNRCWSTSWPQ